MNTKKNIIFEAANFDSSTELILFEKEGSGEFELHITKDAGLSEDGKEFLYDSIVMKLDISDLARLVEVVYPYMKRDGIEI